MADEDQQENALAALFPSPPPFYQHFTVDNVNRIAELRKNESLFSSSVPAELKYLIPPEPPSSGEYRSFGDHYNINAPLPSLRSQGIEQLYSTPPGSPSLQTSPAQRFDRAQDLQKMARSILLNFLELVGLLSMNPQAASQKIDDLRTLFINVHHLINEYRPHQARESLIAMMQDQVDTRKAEIEGVERMKAKVNALLAQLGSPNDRDDELETTKQAVSKDHQPDTKTERQRRLWSTLNNIK